MFEWFKNLFTPKVVREVVYRVVEVKGPRAIVRWNKEMKATVNTLQSHPGFMLILERLALQRQLLESKNNKDVKKDLRECDFLQSGIFWLGYVQELVTKAVDLPAAAPQDAMQEELEAFRELDAKIERVGMDPQGQ
jgi:hypothetical protein